MMELNEDIIEAEEEDIVTIGNDVRYYMFLIWFPIFYLKIDTTISERNRNMINVTA